MTMTDSTELAETLAEMDLEKAELTEWIRSESTRKILNWLTAKQRHQTELMELGCFFHPDNPSRTAAEMARYLGTLAGLNQIHQLQTLLQQSSSQET